jgi:hypothetical protein
LIKCKFHFKDTEFKQFGKDNSKNLLPFKEYM